ncbi:MAG: hypothetical protein ACKODL_01365 [Phenylobacterium sp.]
MLRNSLLPAVLGLALAVPAAAHETGATHAPHGDGRAWLAGDHHFHSQFSVDWKPGPDPSAPPEPVIGGDSSNTIPTNARMARKFGLSWMAATDHGGPNHSRVSRELAYPEVLKARGEVPADAGVIRSAMVSRGHPGQAELPRHAGVGRDGVA